MRKIALLCVICMLLTMVPVMAATNEVSVELKNQAQDIICISGSAPVDSVVSIQIYNPGKTSSDINVSGDAVDISAMQYFGYVLSEKGAFTKDIKLNTSTGGMFTIVVTVDGKSSEISFPYYPYGLKATYVNRIDTETNAELLSADLAEILKVFGFEIHPLYTTTTDLALAKQICKLNSKVVLKTPEDALDFLNEVLVLNAFNEKNANLLKDGKLSYGDIWAAGNADAYNDYMTSLSAEGVSSMNNCLLDGSDYSKLSDVYSKFENKLLYSLIKKNVLSGSGHIEGFLTKYDTQYKAAGFDLSLLTNAENKKTKFLSVLGSTADNLAGLAADFNTIFAAVPEEDDLEVDPGYSGGFGGGGGGGASSVGKVPSTDKSENYIPTETATPEPTPTAKPQSGTFSDVAETHWAYEAVKNLSDAGIVNGRGNGSFDPDAMVTRAEFVKMIVEAFDIPEAETSVSFGDCPADAWFTQYVARAAANNVVNGFDGNFSPDKPITREDAAVIVSRLVKDASGESVTFGDAADISDYAKEAVDLLASLGIINGMGDGNYAPKNNITRAQAAKLVFNVIGGGDAA